MTAVPTRSHRGNGGNGAVQLRPGPLAGNYPAETAMVHLLVIPYLGAAAVPELSGTEAALYGRGD